MNPFRSVGARLALALAVVVAGALAVVWVALVPSLERRLVNGRLAELTASARAIAKEIPPNTSEDFVDEEARATDARVVYFNPLGGGQPTLAPILDSAHLSFPQDVVRDPVALRAASRPGVQRGRVERGGNTYAEVAVADRYGNVVLFASSLRHTLQEVDLVRTLKKHHIQVLIGQRRGCDLACRRRPIPCTSPAAPVRTAVG